jgi:hypothetical protein
MRRPSQLVRNVIVVAVSAVALVGCSPTQASQPDGYGDVNDDNEGYYGNFMYGCTGVEANADGEYVDVKVAQPDFCTCVFRGLKETVNFSEMKEFDEAQAEAEDGETVEIPDDIERVRRSCDEDVDAYS